MAENRNNSRESRRAPMYHGRSVSPVDVQYQSRGSYFGSRSNIPTTEDPTIVSSLGLPTTFAIVLGFTTMPMLGGSD